MRQLFYLLILFTSVIGHAQQPFFYKYDDENGFQSNEVYQVEQDNFGFIWIGCDAGIFRFDGVYFKQFTHPKQTGISISNLKIDREQRVWCQNFSGQIFYIQNDSIHLFKDFTKETGAFPIYTVFENQLVTNINDSTRVYDIKTKNLLFSFINRIKPTDPPFYITLLDRDKKGIYSNTRDALFYKPQNQPYRSVFKDGEYLCYHLKVINNRVFAILREEKTKDWLFVELSDGKVIRQKRFVPTTFESNIHMISEFKEGFAICTNKGVHLINHNFEHTHYYFPNERIADALFDKEGNLWLTSLQNGIYVIPSIDLNVFATDFFPNANITSICKNNNKALLIGTYLGEIYQFDTHQTSYKQLYFEQHPLFKTTKKIIETDRTQIFAIGPKTFSVDKRNNQRRELNAANVRDMLVVNDSFYFIATEQFMVTDLKGGRMRFILEGSGRMLAKHPKSDTIFVGNKNGFFYYIKGKVKPILKNGEPIYPTCSTWQQDTLWLGTLSDGFLAYHNGRFFNHFYEKSREEVNLVRAIKKYKSWLLLATKEGLIRMDLRTKKMSRLEGYEGLFQREIRAIEVIDDLVFLGTTKGLIRFPLQLNAENKTRPNVRFNAIILNDSIEVNQKTQAFFHHNENNLLFRFQTALFRSRKAFLYEFRLKGLNESWQTTNANSPLAQYRSLPAGSYVFQVRAVNEDGVKSKVKTFAFSIALPIWQRWWFVLLELCLVSVFIFWLVNRRIQNIKRQASIENELKTSQLTALKTQMNPHFLYNALNSIQDLILQKDVNNASRYLTKFSHLMRQILEASEHLGIPLSTEVQILNLYLVLEELRFGNKFQYKITLPEGINLETIEVPSMIIQPFVENAIKHGLLHKTEGIKQLTIDFKIQELLICTITDNGIGRENAEKIKLRQGKNTTSFATFATQKRLEILNQTYRQKIGLEIIDLYDENHAASGTKVILRIPFSSQT